MARKLEEGIIKAFCKFVEDTEIPDVFGIWIAMSMVSSALGRDCFIDQGYFVVYPNLYIVLVAGSALCRKSTAIGIGRGFIKKIEPRTHILSQKMTPEALIGSLSGMTAKDDTTLVDEAVGIIIVDELSTLIDRNAFKSGMISVLTKLFDCEDFPYETRGRGIELIRNPCVSILGGSTLHWIKESIPQVAIGGGFTSRVIFVFREKPYKIVPWPRVSSDNKKRADNIVHDLNEVSKMRGNFALSATALKKYEKEYVKFLSSNPFQNKPNLMGYAGRRMMLVLKLAMAASASVSDMRVIEEDDLRIAIEILKRAEKDMPRVVDTIAAEFVGDVANMVVDAIVVRGVITRPELVKASRHKLTVRQLDVIIDTLLEEEAIEVKLEEGVRCYSIRKQKLGRPAPA